MARGHPDLPRAVARKISRQELLNQLQQIDNNQERRERVLRLENAFRSKIDSHIGSLPAKDAVFRKFNTSPYVLLIHARQRGYTKVSELEADILPAKQFSSMETSAGRMVEEVVLPEYGWECVISEMHTTNSALDGKRKEKNIYRLVTLKSGPRCLNDEMSENFADAVLNNFEEWAQEAGVNRIDFTYGVLYGTEKLSNKKDWHILRNIKEKVGNAITLDPKKRWQCQFNQNGIVVDVTVRIGLDWWHHLGGELCFIEVFTALVRACISAGASDSDSYQYTISDLNEIVTTLGVREEFNVSLLQRSQIPWLFLTARHFCDALVE
ncbi:MAG: PmeII family type II restriction endonuclease [Mariprofundaceae bacterium]|nr:PmeII family type II restriction endonuclease [Mariprofundaceae bacterium]